MSTTRIAARYAKPLLELAQEKKVLEQVKADIDNFSGLCESNRDLVLTLKSPIIAHQKKADILAKIFDGKFNELTSSFFALLAKKNRENLLPEIAKEFVKMYNDFMGFQEAVVTTTIPVDAQPKTAFEKLVADFSGKKPMIIEKIDKSLVGGYVVKMGDKQIDDSMSGKLRELRLNFQKENI
jgi:F-type H+-transporting ATPase subunit delta